MFALCRCASLEFLGKSDPYDFAAMTDMCDHCSNIEWAWTPPKQRRRICTLDKSVEELLGSSCRICRVFGRTIPLPHTAIPPVEVSIVHYSIGKIDSGLVEFKCLRKASSLLQNNSVNEPGLRLQWQPSLPDDLLPTQNVTQSTLVHAELIETWLEECKNEHEQCAPTQNISLPGLRVIDCINQRVTTAPTPCSYVALSYVWGKPSPYEESNTSFCYMSLPHTIKDSIKVTLMFGHQYLWVDRYVRQKLSKMLSKTDLAVYRPRKCSRERAADRPNGRYILFCTIHYHCSSW
jgi:hypothetical protein